MTGIKAIFNPVNVTAVPPDTDTDTGKQQEDPNVADVADLSFADIVPKLEEVIGLEFWHLSYSGWRQERWHVEYARKYLDVCENIDSLVENGSRDEIGKLILWLREQLDLVSEEHLETIARYE